MNSSSIFYIVLALFVVWMLYRMFAPVKGLVQLKDEPFRKKLEQSSRKRLIDVREAHEFKSGHLPGAVNIPLSQFGSRSTEIMKGEGDIFLYCQSGMRSKQAAKILLKSGVPEVYNLMGGISSWTGKRVR
ncbi:rhodanese-like domain-containing protein [Paenibacillus sp.]|jgi:rhodanese-related sulfurtransferase|uniref:rhodanese-like domain-containing protein n=1 Tax=Paenibacillus sp. TaxID=58172 RepID=UPI002824C4A8|nr:rhodanese-like domain-containing protein [Paenibacillus sp.]MDR0267353.1 rhodanese-like domain-containing protein [Paenibacillus sp.]